MSARILQMCVPLKQCDRAGRNAVQHRTTTHAADDRPLVPRTTAAVRQTHPLHVRGAVIWGPSLRVPYMRCVVKGPQPLLPLRNSGDYDYSRLQVRVD